LWKVETMIGCFGYMCLEFIDGEQYSMTHSLSLSVIDPSQPFITVLTWSHVQHHMSMCCLRETHFPTISENITETNTNFFIFFTLMFTLLQFVGSFTLTRDKIIL